MKNTRSFDCVAMKQDIQTQMAAEYAGLSPEAARDKRRRDILNDPVLSRFLRDAKAAVRTPSGT